MTTQEKNVGLLALDQVSKRFRLDNGQEIEVLKNINMAVQEGEIIALLGPSGCGKTTMLKIMAGLLAPTQGQVLVKGKPLQGVNSQLAMVFQDPALLPWYSVRQNVALGVSQLPIKRKRLLQRVTENIDLVGLGGFEEAYPKELSGGLRQRVGLARALAMRPALLCLDEPFSSLDALTAEDLRAEIVDLWKDDDNDLNTVVMVTHDIYEAVYMAQKIYVFGENPGHIRTVLNNPLPFPRDERSAKYRELVDVIHSVITEALIPEEEQESPASQPSWYQSLENLPEVGPGEIVGLLEVLENAGGKMDIFELANETESEFGRCLAVVKTAELLDFVDTPKQVVTFTKLGRRFIKLEGSEQRKEIFSERVKHLRVFQVLLTWLDESPDHEISREEVLSRLQGYFPNENLGRLFGTLVAFGRYAEILSYNSNLEVLTLPQEEVEEVLEDEPDDDEEDQENSET